MAGSCLIPGPIEETGTQNNPLIVHLESIFPSAELKVSMNRADGAVIFSVPEGSAVEDPDGDALIYVWYLNYNILAPSFELEFSDSYLLSPCSKQIFKSQDSFTLTTIVSDRPLQLDSEHPDLRTFEEGASTFTVDWDIELYGDCP